MLDPVLSAFGALLAVVERTSATELVLRFFPFALLLELPMLLLVLAGIARRGLRLRAGPPPRVQHPRVSCIVCCYAEGDAVRQTMRTLALQEYPGVIETIVVVDGAVQNAATHEAARRAAAELAGLPRRTVLVVPRWQRGGRSSALNTGLQFATGEVVMALDGDTSFDNDMVARASAHFDDPDVVAVAGNLRVRNAGHSLATRLQAIEYMLSIGAGRTGLSEFNLVNNISGAFGAFRAGFLRNAGGWDAGAAEDLDLTLRLKQYFGRHPNLRIVFDPHAVGQTDGPGTFGAFFRQRLRWEGDLFYLLVRKYRFSLRPRLLGWPNFLFVVLNGLLMQLLQPFVIIGYTAWLFWALPLPSALAVMAFVYLVYLAALALLFGIYLAAVSDRPREDARSLPWLVLFPLFAMAARMHSAFAVVVEIVLKGHRDTSMAPWWVLCKNKF